MADEVDNANEIAEFKREHAIAEIRAKAQLPAGVAGECDLCGEHSPRLVKGACAPCRDKYKLD